MGRPVLGDGSHTASAMLAGRQVTMMESDRDDNDSDEDSVNCKLKRCESISRGVLSLVLGLRVCEQGLTILNYKRLCPCVCVCVT